MRRPTKPKEPQRVYWRDGIAYAQIKINGRKLRESLRTTDPREAERLAAEWIDRVMGEAGRSEPRHTWAEACGRYFLEVAPTTLKASVAERYFVSIRQVHPWLATMDVTDITRKTLADVVSARKKAGGRAGKGASNATINRDLTAISQVLSACVAWGWLDGNPARSFDRRIMTRERRDPIVLPSDEQVAQLLTKGSAMNKALIRFLAFSGMRLNEAATLEWSQVDLKARRVTLVKSKTDRPRVIPLDDRITAQAIAVLQGLPRHLKSPLVFWHTDGRPFAEFSSRFGALARSAKVTFSCHHLRHKFAVDYLRVGGNIYRLQKILGHRSIKTTEIYLDYLTPEEALQAQHNLASVQPIPGKE